MKVLCVGHSSYNITCLANEFPKENNFYKFNNNNYSAGGEALMSAILLSSWKVDTYLATAIGDDSFGEMIKKSLASHGVHQEFIETSYDKSTSLSFVIVNQQTKSRTIFNVSNDYPHIKTKKIDIEPDIIITDGHEYQVSLQLLEKFKEKNIVVEAENFTPELVELCRYGNYVLCSLMFAEEFSGIKADFQSPNTLVMLYNRLKEKISKGNIIVNFEEHGILYSINDEIRIMPGINNDNNKSREIFNGSFVYCLTNNFDLEKAIAISNVSAGLSIPGNFEVVVPNVEEVMNYYQNKLASK